MLDKIIKTVYYMYNNYKYKEMSASAVHFFFVGGN